MPVSASFTAAPGTNLVDYAPESGGSFTKNIYRGGDLVVSDANRLRVGAGGYTIGAYNSAWTPATANYKVWAILKVVSNPTDTGVWVTAHYSPNTTALYKGGWDGFAQKWVISNDSGFSGTIGASQSVTLTVGDTHKVELVTLMSGDTSILTLYVDDVAVVGPISDSSLPGKGKAGVLMYAGTASDSYGIHVESFGADDATLPPATTYSATFSRSANGPPGAESPDITLTADGDADGITVTPTDNGGGGSFDPATVTLVGSTPASTKYIPAATGVFSLGFTNDGSLTDPADLSYRSAYLVNVVFVGDSQTSNGVLRDFVMDALDPAQFYCGGLAAESGRRIDEMISVLNAGQYYSASATMNFFLVMAGANDINQGADATTMLSRVASVCSTLSGLGANVRIIWETLPAGDIVGGPTPLSAGDYNRIRNEVNSGLYESYQSLGIFALSDVAGTKIGPDGAEQQYPDRLHLSTGAQTTRAQAGVGAILTANRIQ